MNYGIRASLGLVGVVVAALLGIVILTSFEPPTVVAVQRGYRGVGIDQVYNPRLVAAQQAANVVPPPDDPVQPQGEKSSEAYQNVRVLGDVDAAEFLRLMGAITNWVAPEQGCNYCHNPENLASDALYTKVVARRMIQMTRHLNSAWTSHVVQTGVTCYTCHRGNPVPKNIWFKEPGPEHPDAMVGDRAGLSEPSPVNAYAALPSDVFTPYLQEAQNIRVQAKVPLRTDDYQSIKQTEWTYGLMMHMSSSLGVNCTYCHNTRAFSDWSQSSPQRVTAWYGIRMVRNLNNDYLGSLQGVFPDYRLGPTGDVAKLNCATCHQGVYKPLYGVSMVKDYEELRGPDPEH